MSESFLVHQFLERSAKSAGTKIAIESEEEVLNYSELNTCANRLAHFLIIHGVKVGNIVSIAIPRSPEMVISVVACLKAGATFVPIDRATPVKRLKHIISESAPVIGLVNRNSQSFFDEFNLKELQVESIINDEKLPSCNPNISIPILTSAYLLFTSGSTGLPKGVFQNHRAISNLIQSQLSKDGINQAYRTLQFTPITFDVSIQEFATSWFLGSPLILLTDDEKENLNDLPKLIENKRIERLFIPPAILNWLAEHTLELGVNLSNLKQIIVAGETLILSQAQCQFLKRYPCCELWNHYGPTETHVVSTFKVTQPQVGQSVPIGKPIENCELSIVDKQGRCVIKDEVGELWVKGSCVGNGYLNPDDRQAEQFCYRDEHPIYKTGDLVHIDEQGNLHFHGRIDDQVQLRGFRIELGEIESILIREPEVLAASVIHINNEYKQNLAVFLKVNDSAVSKLLINKLKKRLGEYLPEYMCPEHWQIIKEWPLTLNGKIDKKALSKELQFEKAKVPLTTKTEQAIAKIWLKVLDLEKTDSIYLGSDSHFFELGGNSLSAIRLVDSIRNEFIIDCNIKDIFDNQKIKQLGELVDKRLPFTTIKTPLELTRTTKNTPQHKQVSFAQAGFWILNQLDNSFNYNIVLPILIDSPLSISKIQNATDSLISIYSLLADGYKVSDQGEIIYSGKHCPPEFTEFNFSLKEFEHARVNLINQALTHTFDLENGPLLKVKYADIQSTKSFLIFSLPHILADGWSIEILLNTWLSLYEGVKPNLNIEFSYRDFAFSQRMWIKQNALRDAEKHWLQKLEGMPTLHTLPTDFSRPEERQSLGSQIEQVLSNKLTESLNEFAFKNSCSLFMLVHAAFSILIARQSQNKDIVIATPMSGRTQNSLLPIVGMIANPVILRTQYNPEAHFEEYLSHIREVNLTAQQYQNYPIECVGELIQHPNSKAYNRLFQIMLSVEEIMTPKESCGIKFSPEHYVTCGSKFDLHLRVKTSHVGEVSLNLEYDNQLFKESTVQQMLSAVVNILKQTCTTNSTVVGQIKYASFASELMAASQPITPIFNNLLQVFKIAVENSRHQIALESSEGNLTYEELENASNRVAAYFNQIGIQPGQFIGLLIPRSTELVIGLLGILKAGAAYVPFDESNPIERLKYIAKNSDIDIVIADDSNRNWLPESINRINIKEILSDSNEHFSFQPPELKRDSPLCLIYTSGSTGTPKGVIQTHGTICNLVESQNAKWQQPDPLKVLQFTPISFDVSIQEFATCWHQKGTLVLMTERQKQELPQLARLICEKEVQQLFLPPAIFSILAEQLNNSIKRSSLKLVTVAGEALQLTDSIREFLHNEPGCELWNHYGPTETHVATAYKVSLNDPEYPPIGQVLDGFNIEIVDESEKPVCFGETGELCISGAGLAKGYHKLEYETANKFITPEFSTERMYKTGDLVRLNSNKQLEYIGRIDNQIKLRGYRIELGEIESVLINNKDVSTAKVTMVGEKSNKRLIGYVIPACPNFSADDLKRSVNSYIKKLLPHYMLPSAIVVLDQLPLTLNGKIDINRLPKPTSEKTDYTTDNQLTSQTQEMKELWSKELKLESHQFNVSDDFFVLGGNSLLAVKLTSKINLTYLTHLSLADFYKHSSVEKICRLLEEKAGFSSPDKIERRSSHNQIVPLTFQQRSLWVVGQLNGNLSCYNQQVCLETRLSLKASQISKIVNLLVLRQPIMSSQFITRDNQEMQRGTAPLTSSYPILDLRNHPNVKEEIIKLAQQNSKIDFDPRYGPLFDLKIVQAAEEQTIWIFTFSHLIFDGWSKGVLMNELEHCYSTIQQPNAGDTSDTIDYFDYANWQQRSKYKKTITQLEEYWKERLKNLPEVHNLPLDRPRMINMSTVADSMSFQLDSKTLNRLTIFSKKQGISLQILLQSAFALTLSIHSNVSEIILGVPVANRTPDNSANLIGLFANTLVLRLKCNPNQKLVDYLQSVKQYNLDAQAHQQVPFESILDWINPTRNSNTNPVFQILFAMNQIEEPKTNSKFLPYALDIPEQESVLDLMVLIEQHTDYCEGKLVYQTALFDRNSIQRIKQHWMQILQQICNTDIEQCKLSELCIESELTPSLIGDTHQYKFKSVLESYDNQVILSSDRPALTFLDAKQKLITLTFQQLDQKANALAKIMLHKGLVAGDKVIVASGRDPLTIICFIALFKIGAVYVPVMPETPNVRLETICRQSQAKLIIPSKKINNLANDIEQWIPSIDALACNAHQSSTLTREQPAYVIYTSGSTGEPKGILLNHGALNNTINALSESYRVNNRSQILQNVALGFDVSISEIWMSLTRGACLHLATDEQLTPGSQLQHLLINRKITHLSIVPSALSLLEPHPEMSLISLIVGGETSTQSLIEQWSEFTDYYVAYGPSECSICCFTQKLSSSKTYLNIGQIIPNMSGFVLDQYERPTPIGSVGELCISGIGVAIEYLNNPEQTQDKFVNWIDQRNHQQHRLYKTGDMVRQLNNGMIVFCGRKDDQIKIRGQRVELKEIEASLLSLPQIASAAVTTDQKTNSQLLGYVVLKSKQAHRTALSDIEETLRSLLPSYLCPDQIIALDELPITQTGKLDKAALPLPKPYSKHSAIVLPTNEIQFQIRQLWADLLSMDAQQISTDVSFFKLGGHSLLLLRLLNQLEAELSLTIKPSEAYQNDTIIKLAELMPLITNEQEDDYEEVEW